MVNPLPDPRIRLICYVHPYASPRYEALYLGVPPADNAPAIRRMIYMKFEEGRRIAESWSRGDNRWMLAWREFDERRRAWYVSQEGPEPVFVAPEPEDGVPERAILPIAEETRGGFKQAYRVWLVRENPYHIPIINYYESLSDRDRKRGRFQVLMRTALVLAWEDPRVRETLKAL